MKPPPDTNGLTTPAEPPTIPLPGPLPVVKEPVVPPQQQAVVAEVPLDPPATVPPGKGKPVVSFPGTVGNEQPLPVNPNNLLGAPRLTQTPDPTITLPPAPVALQPTPVPGA